MELRTLTFDEVHRIHEILVDDFDGSADPISPPGVRSEDLLQSAVGRQLTSLGDTLKYPGPIENAATLLYGICCDHPFHNGNKRTALVAMLAHLDKNRLALFDTRQYELYEFMLRVASHTTGARRDRRRKRPGKRLTSDDEVAAISDWIGRRAAPVVRGESQITYRELRKILQSFGLFLANPKNNSIDIVRIEKQKKGLVRPKEVEVQKRIANIPYPGENRQVAIRHVKYVRKICGLREEDGIDSDAFYSYTVVISGFVNRYRKVLRNLAKT